MKTPEEQIRDLNKPKIMSQQIAFMLVSIIFAIGFIMGMLISKIFWR